MRIDAAAARIGRTQYGLALWSQLLDDGVTRWAILRRIEAGVWTSDGRVVDLGTHAPSWRQAVLRAVLLAPQGALASHLTAAHLHGFLDVGRPDRIELTVPRAGRNRDLDVRLHSTTAPDRGTSVDDIPCVRWPRAAREVGALLPVRQYVRLVADLLRWRDHAPRLLVAELEACGRTAPGRRALRAALEAELGSDRVMLESPLEDQWHRALEGADLLPEAVQFPLCDDRGRVLARFDFAWPSATFALEADGRAHHDNSADHEGDEARDGDAVALGWEVRRVTSADLHGARRAAVLDDIRSTLASRRRRPADQRDQPDQRVVPRR